jgi:S1-C subfamily serine protease
VEPADLKEWSADELVAELRRRQRARGAGGERALGRAERTLPGRSSELRHISNEELTRIARERQRVVYGVDDRKDLYQVTQKLPRRASDSVVALVKAGDLKAEGDAYTLETESYQAAYDLCGSEPFINQPIGCFCSGFLVAPDVIATAGHCVKDNADLARIRFVFGFRMDDSATAHVHFTRDDVYSGKRVIARRLTAADGTDYAVVQLDRPVVGRKPLPIRRTGKVKNGQPVFVIGHPCGLPQKYAPGATVRDNSPAPYFVANLDTYGGNSGSPVFNAEDGSVEGILVRVETDFVSNGGCSVSLVCPSSGCRGEDVTRATVWAGKVPKQTAHKKKNARAKQRRARSVRRK